jgi:hypothetical protein
VTNTGTLLYSFLIQFSNLRNPDGAVCNGKQLYQIALPPNRGTVCSWLYLFHTLQLYRLILTVDTTSRQRGHTLAGLRWRGPAATVNYRPVLSSEREQTLAGLRWREPAATINYRPVLSSERTDPSVTVLALTSSYSKLQTRPLVREGADPSGTALARTSSYSKLQTRPLVRERESYKITNHNCLKEISRRKENWSVVFVDYVRNSSVVFVDY